MKVCFPVIADAGMESTIYGHFASTPFFVIIDTDSQAEQRHCQLRPCTSLCRLQPVQRSLQPATGRNRGRRHR